VTSFIAIVPAKDKNRFDYSSIHGALLGVGCKRQMTRIPAEL
jgi:hypothetical protein